MPGITVGLTFHLKWLVLPSHELFMQSKPCWKQQGHWQWEAGGGRVGVAAPRGQKYSADHIISTLTLFCNSACLYFFSWIVFVLFCFKKTQSQDYFRGNCVVVFHPFNPCFYLEWWNRSLTVRLFHPIILLPCCTHFTIEARSTWWYNVTTERGKLTVCASHL